MKRRLPSLVTVEQLTNLQAKPNGELVAMQADINSLMHLHGAAVTKLRVQSEAIGAVIKSRARPRFEISDHAVVRWLQKIKGMDMEIVRQEIGEACSKAAEATPGVICRAKGDAVEYSHDGVSFIVARHNTIVTVHLGENGGALNQQSIPTIHVGVDGEAHHGTRAECSLCQQSVPSKQEE